MEAITTKFSSIVLLLSVIGMLAYASANSGYGKTQPEIPKEEHSVYQKSIPKIPVKPVIPKEEHPIYQKSIPKIPTKPVIPKEEHPVYQKTIPKIPTKPVIPKEEHPVYQKTIPKIPTKPMIPKEKHDAYQKTVPKIPTKPVMPKDQHAAYEKSLPKLPTMPVIPKQENEGYGKNYPKLPTKPELPNKEHEAYGKNYPKIPAFQKPSLPKVPEHPKNIAVQGIIYCNYGSKLIPLEGATARVTCLTARKDGYESAPFSFSSCPADKKGYFLAKIPSSKLPKDDLWEFTECKAFLENSPWTGCKVPEDTNGGVSGARAIFSRHLNRDGYCLSSVGPFIYNPGHLSVPKEGY